MVEIANNEDLSQEMRFQAHKEAAQYLESKRRAIEMASDVNLKTYFYASDKPLTIDEWDEEFGAGTSDSSMSGTKSLVRDC